MATPTKSNKRGRWKPQEGTEAKRLNFSSEGDWNLAGGSTVLSQTRGSSRAKTSPGDDVADGGSVRGDRDDDSTLSSMTNDGGILLLKKPPSCRVTIEVNPVATVLEKHLKCPECDGFLEVVFPTMCLATSVQLECKNKSACTCAAPQAPAAAEHVLVDDDSVSGKHNTDCAVNVQCVLSFISSGDGGTEAARLNGLIGLPSATHMQSRSFGEMEKQMAGSSEQLTEELILLNLHEEVLMALGDETDAASNKCVDLWKQRAPPREH